MRRLAIALIITLASVPSFAADDLKTEDQKTLYAVGQVMAKQLAVLNLTPAEFKIVLQGLSDAMEGKPAQVDASTYSVKIQNMAKARRNAEGEKLAAQSKEYIEKAAKEKGAVRTESGLIYIPLKEGSGDSPKATDNVKVDYRGTLVDGKEFDSSYGRGKPAQFPLNGVIKCWTEGVQMMKPGGKAKLVCPADIAYGKAGASTVPPDATLVFEVELHEIIKPQAQKPAK
jgi:FKBP-type peptidyl-prolyl cis-trans isomerase FkpA